MRPPPPGPAWEIHLFTGLLALYVGSIVQRPQGLDSWQQAGLGGLCICLFGLFRRQPLGWWGVFIASVLMAIASAIDSVGWVSRFGFRIHRLLLTAHATTLFWLTSIGLLLSFHFRGGLKSRPNRWWEDLPSFRRLVAVVGPLLLVLGALSSLSLVSLVAIRPRSSYIRSFSLLKSISSAEADFRANDRGGTHENGFWTQDVQGLYALVPADGTQPIKLIEWATALADSSPLASVHPSMGAPPSPRGGLWFLALCEDRSSSPPLRYTDSEVRKTRFGFLAYPDDFISVGPYAFMVNEENTIYRSTLKDDLRPSQASPPGPLKDARFTFWPAEEELRSKWDKQY